MSKLFITGDHMTFGRNFLIVKHLYELHLSSSFPICTCGVCAISTTPAFGRCVTVDFRNAAFLKFAIPCAYLFLLFCWEFCILWTCVLSSFKFSSGLLGGKFLCTSLFLQSILHSLATVLVSCPDFILVYSSDIIEF